MSAPYGATVALMRAARGADGRWSVTDLYLHGEELTAETLRGLSIPRMEARLNSPGSALDPGDEDDDGLTVDELRTFGAEVQEQEKGQRTAGVVRTALRRPDRSDPESFYRLVAQAYGEYSRDSKAPAVAIAAEADVPVTTVHRWVREARRRGYLPPARKGKAG